jgi:hypothetical protein
LGFIYSQDNVWGHWRLNNNLANSKAGTPLKYNNPPAKFEDVVLRNLSMRGVVIGGSNNSIYVDLNQTIQNSFSVSFFYKSTAQYSKIFNVCKFSYGDIHFVYIYFNLLDQQYKL